MAAFRGIWVTENKIEDNMFRSKLPELVCLYSQRFINIEEMNRKHKVDYVEVPSDPILFQLIKDQALGYKFECDNNILKSCENMEFQNNYISESNKLPISGSYGAFNLEIPPQLEHFYQNEQSKFPNKSCQGMRDNVENPISISRANHTVNVDRVEIPSQNYDGSHPGSSGYSKISCKPKVLQNIEKQNNWPVDFRIDLEPQGSSKYFNDTQICLLGNYISHSELDKRPQDCINMIASNPLIESDNDVEENSINITTTNDSIRDALVRSFTYNHTLYENNNIGNKLSSCPDTQVVKPFNSSKTNIRPKLENCTQENTPTIATESKEQSYLVDISSVHLCQDVYHEKKNNFPDLNKKKTLPFAYFKTDEFFIWALLSISTPKNENNSDYSSIPEISVTFKLLHFLSLFIRFKTFSNTKSFYKLDHYINFILPFGRARKMDISCVKHMLIHFSELDILNGLYNDKIPKPQRFEDSRLAFKRNSYNQHNESRRFGSKLFNFKENLVSRPNIEINLHNDFCPKQTNVDNDSFENQICPSDTRLYNPEHNTVDLNLIFPAWKLLSNYPQIQPNRDMQFLDKNHKTSSKLSKTKKINIEEVSNASYLGIFTRLQSYIAKNTMCLTLEEYITCTLVESPQIRNLFIQGQVKYSMIGNHKPDMTLSIKYKAEMNPVFFINSCVVSSKHRQISDDESSLDLRIIPLNDPFSICSYSLETCQNIPIKGSYKVRELNYNKLGLNLDLQVDQKFFKTLKCNIYLPFLGSTVKEIKIKTTLGEPNLMKGKKCLHWAFNNKEQSLNSSWNRSEKGYMEISLNGELELEESKQRKQWAKSTENPKLQAILTDEIQEGYLQSSENFNNIDSRLSNYSAIIKFKTMSEPISGLKIQNCHLKDENSTANLFGTSIQNINYSRSYIIWSNLARKENFVFEYD